MGLKKQNGSVGTGLVWLRTGQGQVLGCCEHSNEWCCCGPRLALDTVALLQTHFDATMGYVWSYCL
jgi:hypothetical protein